MADADYGILALGAYLPRYRLRRADAVAANRWFAPSLAAHGEGHRSFCNWDEDAVSMAVEASRRCLAAGAARGAPAPERLALASTTLPFRDRTHAGIVADALGLGDRVRTLEAGASRRAATSSLLDALESSACSTLAVASECLDPKAASADELTVGHGAAAALVGRGRPLALLRAAVSQRADLVDRYRHTDAAGDYVLEERWVREEAHFGFLVEALRAALAEAGAAPESISWLLLPLPDRAAGAVARRLGAGQARRCPELDRSIGHCGTAHPFLALTRACAEGAPGDLVVLAGFGQGADVLVFELGAACAGTDRGVSPQHFSEDPSAVTEERCYPRYLALRGRLEIERGIRSERDDRTAHSVAWRKRKALTAFVGGRCGACGVVQFPAAARCVACREAAAMEPTPLADLTGRVRSFTEDWLAATPRPPLIFGSVDFPGGASVVMEFTDFEPGALSVGAPVRMAFRIKDVDRRRGFRRYFWKPAPLDEAAGKSPARERRPHG